jgi:Carbohydrate family 9 binding domain-like
MKSIGMLFFGIILCSFKPLPKQHWVSPNSIIEVSKASGTITIDGIAGEGSWSTATWYTMNNMWVGTAAPTATDYQGRFKMVYDKNYLYVLAEITDEELVDTHSDGLVNYWDDDCLEIFVDEDASGGLHGASYNAFAYHIGIDSKVVDYGLDNAPHYYNDHLQTVIKKVGNVYTWEVAMKIFPDNYVDGAVNIPSILKKGKKMGFAIAYNDTDGTSGLRQHMMANVDVAGTDKNKGYLDASVFGKIVLK